MSTAIKIFSCKSIYIKAVFAAERALTLISPVDNYCSQFYSMNAQWKINQSFCIAGLYIKLYKINLRNNDKGCILSACPEAMIRSYTISDVELFVTSLIP